ncbi:hypothetical protein IJM16_02575 [Candidatus Saccharibacteria bacterium]|nr:hypothetical protein [Candidatus Saccharibacteria bacterium]
MSSNIPNAPTNIGPDAPKNNNAIIIAVIAIVGVVIIPLIFITVLVFIGLDFFDRHIDDIDFERIFSGNYTEIEGASLTHNESIAVRNFVSILENNVAKTDTIALRDCKYLERIASIDNLGTKDAPVFCNGESVKVATKVEEKKKADSNKYKYDYYYKLYVSSQDVACMELEFDGNLGSLVSITHESSKCDSDSMTSIKLVDTKEELEPSKRNVEHRKAPDEGAEKEGDQTRA